MDYNNFIGIDVAKEKFDVCFLKEDGSSLQKIFNNALPGFKEFVIWINKHCSNPWICMEATGHYSEILADFLVSQNFDVSVVNPVQIKYFAKVRLSRNKNDKVDSKIIAEYCSLMKPRLFKPRSSEQKYIRELIQLEDTLRTQRTQLKLQLGCTQSLAIKKEFEKTIKMLDKRLKALAETIKSTVEGNQEWHHLVKLLTSIKGFGTLSAYRLLAYLPDIKLFKNAKQLAAFIGVSPKQKESGKYAGKTQLSKLGNPRLRNILFMPALNAKRFNEALKPFVNRLQNNGLAPKAIVGAVMRKLVHIIFGMLKSNSSFNPKLV
jgi:transposase